MDDEARRAYEDGLLEDALRDSLARWLEEEAGMPGEPFEIVAWVPVLWSGWEDDHGAVLYRIKGEGVTRIFVADVKGLPSDGRLLPAIEKKADGYESAAERTREFVRKARAEGLG